MKPFETCRIRLPAGRWVVELLLQQGIDLRAVQGHGDKAVSKGLNAEGLAIGDLTGKFPAAQLIAYTRSARMPPGFMKATTSSPYFGLKVA